MDSMHLYKHTSFNLMRISSEGLIFVFSNLIMYVGTVGMLFSGNCLCYVLFVFFRAFIRRTCEASSIPGLAASVCAEHLHGETICAETFGCFN